MWINLRCRSIAASCKADFGNAHDGFHAGLVHGPRGIGLATQLTGNSPQARETPLIVLLPHSPKMNTRVEYVHGTCRRELYECTKMAAGPGGGAVAAGRVGEDLQPGPAA